MGLSAKRPRIVQPPVVEETVAFLGPSVSESGGVALFNKFIKVKAKTFAWSLNVPDDAIEFLLASCTSSSSNTS
ncbi:hypothetical protein CCR75_002551 [Bremia lactucae]|uniref:Uncharacterized protein n=1 Tax=Bremia lactucae TaxID=4779 RepID=A0A976FLZ8_BRELC|nr:hypothetical protein CCR75_002551 [Bremia lactucae]